MKLTDQLIRWTTLVCYRRHVTTHLLWWGACDLSHIAMLSCQSAHNRHCSLTRSVTDCTPNHRDSTELMAAYGYNWFFCYSRFIILWLNDDRRGNPPIPCRTPYIILRSIIGYIKLVSSNFWVTQYEFLIVRSNIVHVSFKNTSFILRHKNVNE